MTPAKFKKKLFRDLNKIDHDLADKISPFLEGLYKHYFRVDIEGFENVTPQQKSLYVGNHNGMITFEVLMLYYAWRQKFGPKHNALGLAHNIALGNPLFSWLLPRIGAIPADPEIAYEALARNYSLLVYPGGEKEAFRPYTERKKVDFFQRKGFIRLAVKAKVPITPIVSIGAHESYIILHRGEELAERLGLKKWLRLHGLPITFRTLFFALCVTTGAFTFFPLLLAPSALMAAFIPLPAKMNFKILPSIHPLDYWDESLTEDENIQMLYDLVTQTMQSTLIKEYEKRRFPIVG